MYLLAPDDAQVIGGDPDRGGGGCDDADVGRIVNSQVRADLEAKMMTV